MSMATKVLPKLPPLPLEHNCQHSKRFCLNRGERKLRGELTIYEGASYVLRYLVITRQTQIVIHIHN